MSPEELDYESRYDHPAFIPRIFRFQVTHVWPRVTARGAVRFETIRLGNVSYNPVIVDNPSDQPLMVQAYISTIGGPEINAIVGAQHCELVRGHRPELSEVSYC